MKPHTAAMFTARSLRIFVSDYLDKAAERDGRLSRIEQQFSVQYDRGWRFMIKCMFTSSGNDIKVKKQRKKNNKYNHIHSNVHCIII